MKGTPCLLYRISLLCKDNSTTFNNNAYKILLYSTIDNGTVNNNQVSLFLKGQSPENLYKNDKSRKKLQACAKALTKFNTWVEAVVERRNGFYFVRDTKLK